MRGLPDDQPARDRILADLDANLLVEAGAGSGKTTSLVGRMLAHVARGTPVERLAAVTFTRKAATELRERFQLELERARREAGPGGDAARRFDRALRDLDLAFLGTIDAFCARLLRERPLEIALDPNFAEVTEEDWDELTRRFWTRWLERARRADDPALAELRQVGLDPRALFDAFAAVVEYPDVEWTLADASLPDVAPCRGALGRLLDAARALMPHEEPEPEWDDLMKLVRRLDFHARLHDWRHPAVFCSAIERMTASQCDVVQKRWSDDRQGRTAAKELGEAFRAFVAGPAAEVLRGWREHRYPVAMRFLLRAADAFAAERRAAGQLGFADLLLLAAQLLREHPRVRAELGARYAHLLVDEFQDTDPVQAEVCLLLASDPATGDDWRRVTPRPGSLFVVGDPKQSIYRFRRADIQTYDLVQRRFADFGAVLALTRNFRSTHPLGALVNRHFAAVFPEQGSETQAAFSPMRTGRDADGADGVYAYAVRPESAGGRGTATVRKDAIVEADARLLASWIARRVRDGERVAGDFLVLTAGKAPIEAVARALAEFNVPATTTGAPLPQEHELEELMVVLRAVADPENPVLVAAALEGLFFGLTPADLLAARRADVRFGITQPQGEEEGAGAAAVGRALARLHEWWAFAQRHPADVLVERVLDDTGLLFHAASQPLGDARAGVLLRLVEALREASVTGAPGITDAMERIAVLLAQDAADAPLRPDRADTVRVMNLHKAKGLEATVVVLAAPTDAPSHAPTVHVRRDGEGRPVGGIVVATQDGRTSVVLAQPPGWAAMAAREEEFVAAERDRLLYVAATRAKRELVVARCVRTRANGAPVPDASAWSPLGETMADPSLARDLPLVADPAPGRARAAHTAAELAAAVSSAAARVRAAAQLPADLRATEVTVPDGNAVSSAAPAAAAWARATGRVARGITSGRRGDTLRAYVRAVARDEALDPAAAEALLREAERIARGG